MNSSNNNNNNNNLNNVMQNMSNMPAMNQIYDGYYYNPKVNNINGFIPNEQNGNNFFYGNGNYYVPMAKMYPNSMGNPPYGGVNSMNHAVNAGNGGYINMEKKL